MKRKHFATITDAILAAIRAGSHLETLTWNYDLAKSNSSAKGFLKAL